MYAIETFGTLIVSFILSLFSLSLVYGEAIADEQEYSLVYLGCFPYTVFEDANSVFWNFLGAMTWLTP